MNYDIRRESYLICKSAAAESKLSRVRAIEAVDAVDASDADLATGHRVIDVQPRVVQLLLVALKRCLHLGFVFRLGRPQPVRIKGGKRAEYTGATHCHRGDIVQLAHHIGFFPVRYRMNTLKGLYSLSNEYNLVLPFV